MSDSSIKVLIVDDEASREALAEYLRRNQELMVHTAGTGEEALDLVRLLRSIGETAKVLEQGRILLRQSEALREVSSAVSVALGLRPISSALISAPELKAVADKILDELSKVVEYRKASLQLIRGDIREMVTYHGPGEEKALSWLLPRISQDSLIRRAVESRAPFVLSRTLDDPDWTVHEETADVLSWVCIPLVYGNETVGLITLDHDEPGHYTDAVKDRLTPFCSQAAIAVYHAYLLADLQRQVRGHQALNTAGADLAVAPDEGEILSVATHAAVSAINCQHCTVFQIEPKEGIPKLVVAATEGNRTWSLPKGRVFDLTGVAGHVARSAKPKLVRNASEDEHFEKGWSKPQPDPRSLVVVPIYSDKTVYGVISAEHDRIAAFDEYDQQLLETLASQIAQAVQNARHIRRLKTLNQVSHDLSIKLDAQSIYEAVVKAVVQTVSCTHCTNFVLENNRLVPHASLPQNKSAIITHTFGIGEGLAGWVAQEGKAVLVRDAKTDERFAGGATRPDVDRSIIVVPVKVGDKVIGVISADQDHVNAFDERDLQMVETLALQASAALQNASLFAESQRRVRDLEIVNRITQIINSQLDPQHLLQTIASQISEQLRCTHCTLFFPKEENGELVLAPAVTHGVRAEIMTRRFKLDEGLVGWVYQHGESLVLADVRQDSRFSPAREIRDLPRSMLVAPVKVGDQTIGVISADQDEFGWFGEYDQRLVDTLAQQAGIAIQRAEGLKLLQDVGNRIISAPSESEILQRIVSGAIELTHTTLGVIYLVSEDGLRIAQEYHHPSSFDLPAPRLDKRQGLTYQIVSRPEIITVPEIEQDERVNRDLVKLGVRSLIGVPLTLDQKVMGVLYLNDKDRHNFTETECSLLATLTSQAAIAIENAHLLERERRRADALDLLRRVSNRISASLDFYQTLALIVQGAMQLTETQSGIVRVLDETGQAIVRSLEFPEGFDHPAPRYTEKKGMTWSVISSGELVVVPDVTQDSRVNPGVVERGVKSMISLPLKLGGKVIGILGLNANEPRQFMADELSLLLTLADQAAVAIENARLYQQVNYLLDRKIRDLQAVYQVSQRLTSGIRLSEQDVLALIHEQTKPLMDTDNMYIALYDQAADVVRFPLMYVEGQATQVPSRSGGKGRTEWIIQNREPIFNKTRAESEAWYKVPGREEYIGEPFASWIGVPMMAGDKVMGVIATYHKTKDHVYTKDDLEVLALMASQAAIVLQNARMWEAMQKLSEDLSAGALLDAA